MGDIKSLRGYGLDIIGGKLYYTGGSIDASEYVPIDNLSITINVPYTTYTYDGKTYDSATKPINLNFTQIYNGNGNVYFNTFTMLNAGNQDIQVGGTTKKNQQMVTINGVTVPRDGLFENGSAKITNMSFSVAGDTQTQNGVKAITSYKRQGESLLDTIWGALVDVWNWFSHLGLDILSKIINIVVNLIGRGFHALIKNALNDPSISVGKIVYGQSSQFTINFWEVSAANAGTGFNLAYKLKDLVNYWHNYFRGLGIAVYLIILLYIGVKILLSSTGKGIEDAKQKLTSWGMGLIILFFAPILMKYTVKINDALVEMVREGSSVENKDIMSVVADEAMNKGILILSIVYCIMVGQLLIIIMTYYKRAFMIAYLIVIFPIVATYYIWEKTQKGGARSLENWTKEYTTLVFTQLVHAIVYAVFIEGMYGALVEGGGNYILYILCVTFLFKAEGIVKQIFNVRSVANTLGDLAASGASAIAVTQSIGSVFKGDGKKEDQDEKDLAETSKQKDTLENSTRERNIRRQVEEEDAAERGSRGGSLENGRGSSGATEADLGGTGGGTGGGDGSGPTGLGGPTPIMETETNQGLDTPLNLNLRRR